VLAFLGGRIHFDPFSSLKLGLSVPLRLMDAAIMLAHFIIRKTGPGKSWEPSRASSPRLLPVSDLRIYISSMIAAHSAARGTESPSFKLENRVEVNPTTQERKHLQSPPGRTSHCPAVRGPTELVRQQAIVIGYTQTSPARSRRHSLAPTQRSAPPAVPPLLARLWSPQYAPSQVRDSSQGKGRPDGPPAGT